MAQINKSALLPYPRKDIFDLVNDVVAYPEYMEGCVGSEVLQADRSMMIARLDLSKGGLSHSFTTKNILVPYECIQLELVDGPFSKFEGYWEFQSLRADACKVALNLVFEVKSPVVGAAAKAVFGAVSNNLVDAVCQRANQLYGNK